MFDLPMVARSPSTVMRFSAIAAFPSMSIAEGTPRAFRSKSKLPRFFRSDKASLPLTRAGGLRVLKIFQGAVHRQIRGGCRDPGILETDSIAFDNYGQSDREDDRSILPGDHVQGLQRHFALVAPSNNIEEKLRAQVIATNVNGLLLRIEGQKSVADTERIDSQVDDGIENSRVRFGFLLLRFGNVRRAVGKDQNVRLRALDTEERNIEHSAQAGEQPQIHLDASNTDEGRRPGRLFAVNHEIRDDSFESAPVERERSNLNSASGSALRSLR